MSNSITPVIQTNSYFLILGRNTELSVNFNINLTIVASSKIEKTVGSGSKVASTFSENSKELIHISSSATVPQWRRVSHLARMAVGENEIVELCAQLNSIMSFVDQLSSVDVTNVEPMTSVTPMEMKMRADVVTDGGIPDAIVGNAPVREGHFFVVPKVVE